MPVFDSLFSSSEDKEHQAQGSYRRKETAQHCPTRRRPDRIIFSKHSPSASINVLYRSRCRNRSFDFLERVRACLFRSTPLRVSSLWILHSSSISDHLSIQMSNRSFDFLIDRFPPARTCVPDFFEPPVQDRPSAYAHDVAIDLLRIECPR